MLETFINTKEVHGIYTVLWYVRKVDFFNSNCLFAVPQIANEMNKTVEEMGKTVFPVKPGETFHTRVCHMNLQTSKCTHLHSLQLFCFQ